MQHTQNPAFRQILYIPENAFCRYKYGGYEIISAG